MTKTTYDIETSLTLDYRKFGWGIERIVLDSISNHLPDDSQGTVTRVRIKQNGRLVDLKEADPSLPSEEVVFEDDGSGYDAGLLSVLFSPKLAGSLAVGQFGEGLKMVAAAALRNGLSVEYRSRNWKAHPYAKAEVIDTHNLSRLCFKVTENGDQLEGSRTVFTNPTPQLIQEVFQLPQKVLALNDTYKELHRESDNLTLLIAKYINGPFIKEIHQTPLVMDIPLSRGSIQIPQPTVRKSLAYKSRIIDLGTDDRALFIKGVRVQGIHSLFSYDLGLENISPDRIYADRDSVLDDIGQLLKGCRNAEVIETVLRAAEQHPNADYHEFEAFKPRLVIRDSIDTLLGERSKIHERKSKNIIFTKGLESPENLWAVIFRKIYGENAVLSSDNTNVNKDAEIMGYNPIRLNRALATYLGAVGVQLADDIENEQEYRWVDTGQLTEAENAMLRQVSAINRVVLEQDVPVEVRVYSGLFLKTGREIESSNGVHVTEKGGKKYVGIKRSRLGSLEDFTQTYIHELGHHVTGADDADRRFTEFFVRAVSKLAMDYMGQGK